MKCDVRHICILKKKMANGRLSMRLFPPVEAAISQQGHIQS